jgi:hypothetical protein
MKPQENHRMRTSLVILIAALALGCSKTQTSAAEQPVPTPVSAALAGSHDGAGAPAVMPGQPDAGTAGASPSLTGTVLETMNAAGYTYLKLKTADGETWAAVNESKVEKGKTVTVLGPMPMDGFESKTLNRKFDHIVFGTLAGSGGAPAAPAAMGGMPGGMGSAPGSAPAAMGAPHAAAAAGPEVTEKISVAKAEGSDGRTVAELFAQRAALKGKAVAVRGKVVKVNEGIMGKNWIHLRDGSGTRATKDDDLTVTKNDKVALGDVVLVKGTVAVDRDFGAGYTYTLVVEDAKAGK